MSTNESYKLPRKKKITDERKDKKDDNKIPAPKMGMTPQEAEAFRRGVMLAFVTATIQNAVKETFKRYPHLVTMDTRPNEVANKLIFSIYTRLGKQMPTLEEAVLNVNIMKDVGKELLAMRMEEMGFSTSNAVKPKLPPQNTTPSSELLRDTDIIKKVKFELSDKEKEELR